MLRRTIFALCVLGFFWPGQAAAQMMNPGGQRPGGGLGSQPKKDKPAGPAEAPPEAEEEEEAELPALPPWPGQETKKLQLFQMKGYLRLRIDLFHNGNLGMGDIGGTYKAPFYRPISETSKSTMSCADRAKANKALGGGERGLDGDGCPAETLAGANMRLRLEPTINISEDVRIHAQFDLFDNLVLGSTPNGLTESGSGPAPHVPLTAFADTQAPPIAGVNSRKPAILVKRAWAEVGTPFGQLRFGRMPSQWGLGLLANNGSCWDCNYGDSADRIMFVTKLMGHIIGAGYDFASSGPNSLSVNRGSPYSDGQAIDLEPLDDVSQWIFVVGKIDPAEVVKDTVERGELLLNYGSYVVYRQQNFDYPKNSGLDSTVEVLAANMVERHAWAVIPDLWIKLMYKKFYLEAEAVIIYGKIENTSDQAKEDPLDIMQWGWALKSHYKFLKDSLTIGIEMGMASGDQSELFYLNRRQNLILQDLTTKDGIALDTASNEFRFDNDYHVDLILFREIMGSVANAFYWKPWVQYNLMDSLGARLNMIHSVAHKPIAYPGNDPNLGVELDLDIFYKNVEEGFFFGLQYGVLFPLDGLDRPAEIPGIGSTYEADAEVAHTVQARLIVQF